MSESAYNNMMNIMINAGELDAVVPFNKVVDNTIAQKVINEL